MYNKDTSTIKKYKYNNIIQRVINTTFINRTSLYYPELHLQEL